MSFFLLACPGIFSVLCPVLSVACSALFPCNLANAVQAVHQSHQAQRPICRYHICLACPIALPCCQGLLCTLETFVVAHVNGYYAGCVDIFCTVW